VNVGISDPYPDARLEVSAFGSDADLFMLSSDNNTDGDIMVVKNNGSVGINTTSPDSGFELDVEGDVQAHSFDTGDITFRKDGQILWRMFEDENGLYLEQTTTGKIFRVVLEPCDQNDSEIKKLKMRIDKLEKTLDEIRK
jgi:hypothetical protein